MSNLLTYNSFRCGMHPVIELPGLEERMRIHRSERGFSFIEMLVVMILIGIIASLAIPRLRGSLEKQNIRSAKALAATLVATARSVAVQRPDRATAIVAENI